MDFDAPTDPLKYEAALAWFRDRVPITDDELEELEASIGRLSFRVAGATQLDVVTSVWEALDDAMERGTDFDEFKEDVGAMLETAWSGEIPGRLETIFRTNLQNAYGAGRYTEQYNPEAIAERPFVRLDTTMDSRESDICEALNNVGAVPKDGAFIKSHHPPLHFNCRTLEVDLTPEEAAELGLTAKPPTDEAQEGFGGVPDFAWEPELDEYPEPLRTIAQDKAE